MPRWSMFLIMADHSLRYHTGGLGPVVGGYLPWYLSSHSAPSCGETRPLDHGIVLYPLTNGSLLSATTEW